MSSMSTSEINYSGAAYVSSASGTVKSTSATAGNTAALTKKESAVDAFKRRNPSHARHVDEQVKAGYAIKRKNGAAGLSTENMTMEEYQEYFYALLDTIPYDSTRRNDVYVVSISDRGWEQMRQDPEYEAWILGYFVEDRAVRNPFFGWGNKDGNLCIERFGASIEEHLGQGFSLSSLEPEDLDEEDKDSWWIARHKKIRRLIKEQAASAMAQNQLRKTEAREEYTRLQYAGKQRQHQFLTSGNTNGNAAPEPDRTPGTASFHTASAAYNGTMDLFCGMMEGALETPSSVS